MKSGSEEDVKLGIQRCLDELRPGRFKCSERKSAGVSVIKKPVDLEILDNQHPESTSRVILAIEVANVNTTQLVGETCRLYYDCCPLKLLVLGNRNVKKRDAEMCRSLMARLYGQEKIENTPARIINYDDDTGLREALRDLLLL